MNTLRLPDYRQLVLEIKSGRDMEITARLEQFWNELCPFYSTAPKEANHHLFQFATSVADTTPDADSGGAALNEAYLTFVRLLSVGEDPEMLYQPYCDFFQQAAACFSRYSADSGFQKITQIQSYLRSHLAEDLSLKDIADLFFFESSLSEPPVQKQNRDDLQRLSGAAAYFLCQGFTQ